YVAENVQRLHVPRRRPTIEAEAPMPAPAPRMETPAISRMMNNLAEQLDTLQMTAPSIAEPVARREPAPVIPVPPPKVQLEEPFVLGGSEAPMIADPVSVSHYVSTHIEPKPAVTATKRFLGLFGRRRTEREEYPVEPRMETPAPTAPRQPIATTPTRQTMSAPAQPVSQPQQAQAPSARTAGEPPRQQPTPSADDL